MELIGSVRERSSLHCGKKGVDSGLIYDFSLLSRNPHRPCSIIRERLRIALLLSSRLQNLFLEMTLLQVENKDNRSEEGDY